MQLSVIAPNPERPRITPRGAFDLVTYLQGQLASLSYANTVRHPFTSPLLQNAVAAATVEVAQRC